jgi:3'-phosphoadenosine 5'-phosphosulfate sulfotransferase (PAPS reductase)/FAD synthetase
MEWNVNITWLEYTGVSNGDYAPTCYTEWKQVTHATASRSGEPFETLNRDRARLPNPIMRICTQEMKIRPMTGYMFSLGYTEWVNVIGLRRDEPRRVAKKKAGNEKSKYYDSVMPLFDDGITEKDVLDFWKGYHFDLGLRSYQGNCDLCYLKGFGKLIHIIEENPSLADWWIEQEYKIGKPFREDRPSYAKMKAYVQQQGRLFEPLDDDTIPCTCTD